MIEHDPFKLAFIGSHGVGKTTLCFAVAARLKRRDVGVEVVHEVARRCPLPINEATSTASQSWILHTQVAEEVFAAARYPVVLCDRSVLDNYVYQLLSSGPTTTLAAVVDSWLGTYDLLVHVPLGDRLRPDGLRSADPSFQLAVEERIQREVDRRGLDPLRLEPGAHDDWPGTVEAAVLDRLRSAQIRLL